jgi:hypothetical protein
VLHHTYIFPRREYNHITAYTRTPQSNILRNHYYMNFSIHFINTSSLQKSIFYITRYIKQTRHVCFFDLPIHLNALSETRHLSDTPYSFKGTICNKIKLKTQGTFQTFRLLLEMRRRESDGRSGHGVDRLRASMTIGQWS